MARFKKLIGELHRRSLWQVLGIYLAGSWVAIQVVESIGESAGLPDWLPGLALALLVIGLPVVLATAFVQEGAPGARTRAAAADESVSSAQATHATGVGPFSFLTWRFAIAGGVAAFALWGVVATFLLLGGRSGQAEASAGGRLAIAVLPFTSVGSTEDDESFALGIHDDVLTRLAKIGSLRVISRTSVMEYKDYAESVGEIAESLGADVILEGSVQRSGDRLHLNAQLIDARADEAHLWAESFDRSLTVENIFLIQGELAGRIATALDRALTTEEQGADTPLTENMEAYRLYQRANNYLNVGPRNRDFRLAFDLFEQATTLDPGFTQAYARHALARARAFELAPGLGGLEDARRIAQLALALDGNNGEAHLAMSQYLYTGFRDYEGSLREIEAARAAGLSSSADLYHNLGATQRRMGDFDGAIESFREAVRLDPLSSHMMEDLGDTYAGVRRHAEAVEAFQKMSTLSPNTTPRGRIWRSVLYRDGDTSYARTLLDDWERESGGPLIGQSVELAALEGDHERAYTLADSAGYGPGGLAVLAARAGRPEIAHRLWASELEAAQERLDGMEDSEVPGLVRQRAFAQLRLGAAQAGVGMFDQAVASAESAMEAIPVSADAMDGPGVLYEAAGVLVAAGRLDRAREVLETFFGGPGNETVAYLDIDPAFDALRAHPRYRELVSAR